MSIVRDKDVGLARKKKFLGRFAPYALYGMMAFSTVIMLLEFDSIANNIRNLLDPGKADRLRDDYSATGGVELESIPNTKAFIVRMRESVQLAGTNDQAVLNSIRNVRNTGLCDEVSVQKASEVKSQRPYRSNVYVISCLSK